MSRRNYGDKKNMGRDRSQDFPTNLGRKINELGSNVDRLKGNFSSFHFQPRLHLAEWVSHALHIRQAHWNNRMIQTTLKN